MAYNIKQRRLELGLTLAEVADAVGVSKGTVSKWESGKTQNMRADNAYILASVLGVSVIEFLSEEISENPLNIGKGKNINVFLNEAGDKGKANIKPLIFKDCASSPRAKKAHINQELFKSSNANIYNPLGKLLSKDSLFANSDYSWQTSLQDEDNRSTIKPSDNTLSDSTAEIYDDLKSPTGESESCATLMLLRNGCEPIITQLSAKGFAKILKAIEEIKATD